MGWDTFDWTTYLENDEINMITGSKNKHIQQPLKAILNPDNSGDMRCIKFNTEDSVKVLKRKNAEWLDKIKPRLLDINDFSNSISALAEIRAYGYLLSAGFNVKPIKTSNNITPDFEVSFNSNSFTVEVATKVMSDEQANNLEKFLNNKKSSDFSVHSVAPFNYPKSRNENITENAISKICAIKSESSQLHLNGEKNVTILWIDFQSEDFKELISERNLTPVRSFNGELTSGEIWYAFFGKIGLPILEGEHFLDYSTMKHNGRYISQNKPDYTIISFAKSTVIIENPYSPIKLEDDVIIHAFLQMPRFRIESSIIHMSDNYIEDTYQNIFWLYNYKKSFFYQKALHT